MPYSSVYYKRVYYLWSHLLCISSKGLHSPLVSVSLNLQKNYSPSQVQVAICGFKSSHCTLLNKGWNVLCCCWWFIHWLLCKNIEDIFCWFKEEEICFSPFINSTQFPWNCGWNHNLSLNLIVFVSFRKEIFLCVSQLWYHSFTVVLKGRSRPKGEELLFSAFRSTL